MKSETSPTSLSKNLPMLRAALDALIALRLGSAFWRARNNRRGDQVIARLPRSSNACRFRAVEGWTLTWPHCPAKRIRQLSQEGLRLTAQRLRTLQPLRRHTTLVATIARNDRHTDRRCHFDVRPAYRLSPAPLSLEHDLPGGSAGTSR